MFGALMGGEPPYSDPNIGIVMYKKSNFFPHLHKTGSVGPPPRHLKGMENIFCIFGMFLTGV